MTSYTVSEQPLVDSVGGSSKVPGAECQIRQQVNNGSSSAGLFSDHPMPNNKPTNSFLLAVLVTGSNSHIFRSIQHFFIVLYICLKQILLLFLAQIWRDTQYLCSLMFKWL